MTLFLTILFVALLILVHEWGHFYSARRLGVRVEEFGFGFPPRLFARVKNGVRYSLNLLPFGGFVKIFGEHGEGEGSHESFASRPPGERFSILFAGIAMNFVLAWLLFAIGATLGVPTVSAGERLPVSIIAVTSGSPAEAAGLKFGDRILEMRGPGVSLRVETEQDVRDFSQAFRGEEITLLVQRGSEIREIRVTPRHEFPEGDGPLGVGLARLSLEQVPWYQAPLEGGKTFLRTLYATIYGLGFILTEIFTTGTTTAAVSGPVGIFAFAQDMQSLGAAFFLQFIGILSVNLGFLNLLPIPALDGGRILFLAIEKLRGSRVRPELENAIHTLGFFALILLMVLVTYHDIARVL